MLLRYAKRVIKGCVRGHASAKHLYHLVQSNYFFFCEINPSISMCVQKTGCVARIVFEVSLEGSARKLVTVRSALTLVNKLPHAVEVRVDHAPAAGTCLHLSV